MHRREVLLAGLSWPLWSLLGGGQARAWAPAGPAVPFDADSVARMASALAAKPFVAQSKQLPASLERIGYDQYREHPLQSGAGAVAKRRPAVPGAVLPSRLLLPRPRGHPSGGRREGDAGGLQGLAVHLRPRHRAEGGRPGLCRFPPACADQPTRLLRRGRRLPGRELLPRRRQGPGLWPVRARTGAEDRRRAGGIPGVPRVLAGTPGARSDRASSCTRCSTAPASPARTASRSRRAWKPCSTSPRACIRAWSWTRWASRR